MEERGLLIVDGQPETAIKVLPAFNAPSLYWRVRNELSTSASPREVWRETLCRACAAVSQQVRVLFDPDSEYTALLPLQPTLQKITEAFNSPDVSPEIYAQDETLGWVYQYYNQQEKNQVYEQLGKGKKIERPRELAAATCLYTERYMVDYLLQNTLGALWVEMHADTGLPGQWPYYVRPSEGSPRPQRPTHRVREITVMDPACGSGHFLVRAFDILVQMYNEEGLERQDEIAHLILERNLHGIDIDLRAVQIAALALYLKGCALASPGFKPRRLNLVSADAVLPGDAPPKEYMKRFKGDPEIEALVTGIWQGLRNVREFGSLLHPERAVEEVVRKRAQEDRQKFPMLQRGDTEWALWKAELLHGLREEFEKQADSQDLGQRLFGEEAAKGVSLVEALGGHYDVVVTNPPYAGSGNLNPRLKTFLEKEYKEGKRDLYAAFILRCRDFCKPDSYVGMVTQQSWMFIKSFEALRKDVLEQTTVATLAHLGPRAFEEISGEVVNIVLSTLSARPPEKEHCIIAFRLVHEASPQAKDTVLKQMVKKLDSVGVYKPTLKNVLGLPKAAILYWLPHSVFELTEGKRFLGDYLSSVNGSRTGDNERFLRFHWEVLDDQRKWRTYAKGGSPCRWDGNDTLVIDWSKSALEYYRSTHICRWTQEQFWSTPGITFSKTCGGRTTFRYVSHGISDYQGPTFVTNPPNLLMPLLAALNTHYVAYMAYSFNPSLVTEIGDIFSIPIRSLGEPHPSRLNLLALNALSVKRSMLEMEVCSPRFRGDAKESVQRRTETLVHFIQEKETKYLLGSLANDLIHSYAERVVSEAFGLDWGELVEAGLNKPLGWLPMIENYANLPQELMFLRDIHSDALNVEIIELPPKIRDLLASGYKDGSGQVNSVSPNEIEGADDMAEELEDHGKIISLPITETLLDELSLKTRLNPLSVYLIIKELREQEGLVCPPELERNLEDYVSVTVLRLLGYRWPEQDAYEREHGPIIDPSLVVEDGIIPLVPCGDQPTAAERVRRRLERDFGDEGASQSEAEFRQWVGRSIEDWLRRDFFRRHVQQLKQRPIAWHLVSPERTIEVLVLYHKLNRATLQKLRAQYAGGLIARLQAEQARAKARGDTANASRLQIQIEDVKEFRSRIEAIERGEELQSRIRCRWKGEEETGRPGPYAPDIDDGVKVNIRPFQEAGLLTVKEVIKKW
jgi:hypothetical protein